MTARKRAKGAGQGAAGAGGKSGARAKGADRQAAKRAAAFAGVPPVLIVAAEAAPLAKTGGLADVVGALPKYLKRLGVDARIIMPFHRAIKDR